MAEEKVKSLVKQVLGDRVLLELDAAPETTTGGLIIAQEYREKKPEGIIIAVGPKVETVKAGDHIKYSNHAGVPVELEGKRYQFIRESDIHYIIEPKETNE